jgi:organic radical activating enzyme
MKLARLDDGPEIFFSLQGEGKNQGAPSVFVRTSRCNLYCSWCDTPYTWNWHGTAFAHAGNRKYDAAAETVELNPAEVASWIRRWPCLRVVLTGGEPLLQAAECTSLLTQLKREEPRYAVEVETNGTLVPPPELDTLLDQYTVSPKLLSSGVETSLRLREEPLTFFARSPKSVFKFVIGDAADTEQVLSLAAAYRLDPDRVYLMPQGTTPARLAELAPSVAAACMKHGYRFSDRLHIHLFGNRAGV